MRRMRQRNTADRRKQRTLLLFLLITLALVITWAILVGRRTGFGKGQPRTNPRQSGTARVYDYADMLTAAQEAALEERIKQAQERIHADIVIVLINESLEEKYEDLIYLRSDETDAYRGIERYAQTFWKENGFGWNEAGDTGNGIIMVDNIYRESNGWVYNWVAGAGDMRFSVGDESCQKLSQAFTDRLPYGDMPQYDQVYADALLSFVEDCDSFGNKVRSIMGWSLFTPSAAFSVITSSIVMTLAVVVCLCVIFGRMVWHMHYNGKQKKAGRKGSARSGAGGVVLGIGFFILCALSGGLALLGMILYVIISATLGSVSDKKKAKKESSAEPFAQRDVLLPDSYRVMDSKDTLVRHYVTTHSDSDSSGGSGGGGGFSGGGGGGGGFSGGGSHR